eukprot:4738-Alexandrium_andersonii.AAC.1
MPVSWSLTTWCGATASVSTCLTQAGVKCAGCLPLAPAFAEADDVKTEGDPYADSVCSMEMKENAATRQL